MSQKASTDSFQPKGDYATITRVVTIENKIPSEASPSNQLADKTFVEDLVSTNSATFRGTYDTLAELQQQDADTNDYGFVRDNDSAGNSIFKRYKYNGSAWIFEYDITNIRFTQAQQNAIDSGITSNLVDKLNVLPNNTALTNSIADAKKAGTDAQSDIDTHAARTDNPHNVTKVQVGLGNVNNTSDADKPVSTATQLALDGKVDKVPGKQLSTEDYTAEEKQKLAGIASGAEVNVLEGVQVSGVDLTITNKKVNVDLTPITNVIPTQASSSNQLADKNFVNSSIATSTATFQGTSAAGLTQAQFEAWLETLTADDNDYVYWNTVDSVGNVVFKRYKYNGTAWVYEYDLNNSSFTSTEWAAIRSGVTAELVTKLVALPTNASLTEALNNKVDKVTGKALSKINDIIVAEANSEKTMTISKNDGSSDLVVDLGVKFSAAEKTKLSGIESNAQVNKLEGVQVNGTDLTITNKKVNVTVPTKTSQLTNDDNVVKDASYVHTDNNYTAAEKTKLSGIEEGAQVNKIEHIQINDTEQTISNKTVNLPAYPTTLPASDVYSWAKASTKPSYNFSEIGGTVADSQLPDTISSDITGTAMGLKTEKLTGQEFVYRATPNTIKAKSLTLDRICGKTLAWNQQVNKANIPATITLNGITYANNGDGTITLDGTSSNSVASYAIHVSGLVEGHKYLFRVIGSNTKKGIFYIPYQRFEYEQAETDKILTCSSSGTMLLYIQVYSGREVDNVRLAPQVVDLTLAGIDSEISTVAEFEAIYPGYHDYEPGKLISNDAESIETVGFNQWDEETLNGYYSGSNGEYNSSSVQLCTKNKIPVFPSTNYYIQVPAAVGGAVYKLYYDIDENFISGKSDGGAFTTPSNCCYLKVNFGATTQGGYGTTYNHDICINLSDPAKNGTYEPYRKSTMQLNLGSFQVRDSQGNVTTIEGGLKSAGSVKDEIVGNKYIKRVGRVDLGTLRFVYNSTYSLFICDGGIPLAKRPDGINDVPNLVSTKYTPASTNTLIDKDKQVNIQSYITTTIRLRIKDSGMDGSNIGTDGKIAALNGSMLYYALATPIEYDLAEPLVPTVKAGTTEARISPNEDGLSAPFCADMTYSVADYTEYADRAGTLVKGASVDLTDITASGELSGNAFKVIAEHIAKLTSRVEALEAGVGTVDTLSSTSVDSANGYYINGDKTVIIGSGAPTMIPAFAGQFYINTSGPALYYAVNNNATTN